MCQEIRDAIIDRKVGSKYMNKITVAIEGAFEKREKLVDGLAFGGAHQYVQSAAQ
jgi:hypothetical protein